MDPPHLDPALVVGILLLLNLQDRIVVDNHGAKIGEYGNASNMTKSHLEQHQEKDKGQNFEQRFQSATAIVRTISWVVGLHNHICNRPL